MSDDQMIVIFLTAGVTVIGLVVLVGMVSSRRTSGSARPSFTEHFQHLGDQPFIRSSDVALGDRREWELFQQLHPVGSVVADVPVPGDDGRRTLHVSSVRRSLRAGWPNATWGFTAYFTEYEGSDLPVSLPVRGNRNIVTLRLDTQGVAAMDGTQRRVWASLWADLQFSNGTDLILRTNGSTIHIETSGTGETSDLTELLIKYGTFRQMHF
jgi:hypothetical protein